MANFETYPDLSEALVDMVVSKFSGRNDLEVKRGFSNQSCSAYVNASSWSLDGDGDQEEMIDDCKIRFSDHSDRYGADLSIQFNDYLDSDVVGNVEIADWRMAEMVDVAVKYINEVLAA